jgi:isopentenyl diphosphate isomerase/L-lactate dehydrogenase-like FMN-dependent dehydrogenase
VDRESEVTGAGAGASELGGRQPLSAHDYERLGQVALNPALAGYVLGGAGEEWTLRENRAALKRWSLCPRVMVDVEHVQTTVTVLGTELSMPLLVAPLAFLGMASPTGEIATARAASAQGTVMCLSTFATVSAAQLACGAPESAFWFQLYLLRDRGLTSALVEQAATAGASALLITADAPRIGYRERDLRSGFSIPKETPVPVLGGLSGRRDLSATDMFRLIDPGPTWARVEEVCALTELPVLIKGVLDPRDGRAACEHGAAGVIVSNHGGRQLDGTCASLDALPEVVEAVGGRAPVLVDGGLRRGSDVLKALALGAEAVLIGRPAFWALAARGEAGVAHLLSLLRSELELALALLGCKHPREVGLEHLRRTVG